MSTSVALYQHFLHNGCNLHSQPWIEGAIRPYCQVPRLGIYGSKDMLFQQIPSELSQFLTFLGDRNILKFTQMNANSLFYAIDSYLRLANGNYDGGSALFAETEPADMGNYCKQFTNIQSLTREFARDILAEKQTLVVLDEERTQGDCWRDFYFARASSQYVAVMNIFDTSVKVWSFWRHIRTLYKHWEFEDTTRPLTLGIGLLQIRS